jgi:hypothetical protein
MKKFKKFLRILGLSILILLACAGIGIVGQFLPRNRESYMNKQTLIELVERKDDELENESEAEKT